MIKRTLYFGNPTYLRTSNEQLVIELADAKAAGLPPATTPIEDLGVVVLDHQQITISQAVIAKLLANNVALICCDASHHPTGLMLNLDGHTLQSQKYKTQIEASQPLLKQLWQQTIMAKIGNQAALLAHLRQDEALANLLWRYAREVRSGDPDNNEAKAAAYYWRNLWPPALEFTRDRYGTPPNNMLNYGYALLRATMARSLVGSGLLPTLGIHHRNQYNAYCLADDIMEPYRPYVDMVVYGIVTRHGPKVRLDVLPTDLSTALKRELLGIPAMDVTIDGQKSPLMNAMQRTTASLARCLEGDGRKLQYPAMEWKNEK